MIQPRHLLFWRCCPRFYDHRRSPLNSLSLSLSLSSLSLSLSLSLALWAKHSQVLARFTRLNRRQPQRSAESCIGEPHANCENSRVAVFSKAEYYKRPLLVATSEECQTRNQDRHLNLNAPRFLRSRSEPEHHRPLAACSGAINRTRPLITTPP